MLQAGGELDLTLEALGAERGRELGQEHLEGDRPVMTEVVRQIDDGHSTAPELAVEGIGGGQGRLQLRGQVRQVSGLEVAGFHLERQNLLRGRARGQALAGNPARPATHSSGPQPTAPVTAPSPKLVDALRDRYVLERELGQGGMATVYLAHDVRHRRPVAVKVLRPELAATLGADRFLLEIETAARFQHPHILPLLDSGEASGFLYYVMPYIDGESLRARLTREGELPVHETVKLLIEVTDALAYAHAQGVVHRDIKPDNVLISGRHALVTDFGVAKALSEATGRQQLTTAGVALGTPAYMAPEQATADPNIDHRADIYALGVMGYELIAGRPPFIGRTGQEILAAQVTQTPPPLCGQRPACPPELEAVLMRCLEKRPADRWQTADQLLAQLEPLLTPSGGTTPATTRPVEAVAPAARPARWRRWAAPAALLLVLAAALAFFVTRPPAEVRLGRRVQLTLDPGLEIDPALSPDGELVAYAAGPLGETRLYVRQVDGGTPVALTRADGGFARVPQWSPDGRRLLYLSERGLEVMPALGGPSKLVLAIERGVWTDGTWSPDGRSIAFALDDSVFVRPVDGGPARAVARLAEAHSCAWSPDGHRLACVSGNRQFLINEEFGNHAASSVWIVPADRGAPLQVTDDEANNVSPVWLPGGGTLLYLSDRDGGRDLYELHLTRAGRPAGDAARLTTGLNAARVSVASHGRRLAYATLTESANVWSLPIPSSAVTSVAQAEPVTTGTQTIEGFDLSRDRRWLAFDSDRGGTAQIYRMSLVGSGEVEQLTSGTEPAFAPVISADGREIAYHAFQGGTRQIFVMPADGGQPSQVTTGSAQSQNPEWSPDGRALTFVRGYRSPAQELMLVTRDARGRWSAPRALLRLGILGVWAPEGHSILSATGVVGLPGALTVASVDSGGEPRVVLAVRDPAKDVAPAGFSGWAWSADGRMIYFAGQDPRDRSVAIWRMLAAGGVPRRATRFDDPNHRWFRASGLRVRGDRFYFNLGDQQSDLWMAEIADSR
jgi:Tol biopolymer transport system component